MHLSAAYKAQVVAYVSSFLEELRVLPWSVHIYAMSKVTGLAAEEASFLFEALTVLNTSPCLLWNGPCRNYWPNIAVLQQPSSSPQQVLRCHCSQSLWQSSWA